MNSLTWRKKRIHQNSMYVDLPNTSHCTSKQGRDADQGLEFDSQIDEDLAFTVEDEEAFGHIFDKLGGDKLQDEVKDELSPITS